MIKKLIPAFALFLAVNTYGQDNLINQVKNNESNKVGNSFGFEVVVDNEATSVKSQGRSGTCWSYSGNSFLESEVIKKTGKQIDLSEMFVVRKVYEDKGMKYVRMHGYLNFGQGGALHDPIDVLRSYGAIPQNAYNGLLPEQTVNMHGELSAMLKAMLDAVLENKNGQLTSAWNNAYKSVLDVYLGNTPNEFEYEGKKYTPKSFADKVVKLDADDYVEFTSITNQPYYKEVFIEVPDNWSYGLSYNIKPNEMVDVVDAALKDGYTVAWATDVSEKGFNIKNGLAVVPEIDFKKMTDEQKDSMFDGPKTEKVITAENRQVAYDNWETQDDHGMHIVGIVKDKNGKEYYTVKNSWGKKYNNGYLYVSKAFFKYKTTSFMLNKNSLTKSMKKKLNIKK
ncbi:MAG: aminopeptidase [Ichthyobacteriaceae bacterium]|nr:aminopeptidase [Ichthyobacteriaceae bacterium]